MHLWFDPQANGSDVQFFFSADDGVFGRELWTSDGSKAGTKMVDDICQGACNSAPFGFTRYGGYVYFSANGGDVQGGRELWRTSPEGTGTELVTDVLPGGRSSSPRLLIPFMSASGAQWLVFVASVYGHSTHSGPVDALWFLDDVTMDV